MSKKIFFVKYLKHINNLINNLLEKNLNKLNSKNLGFLIKNNKIILTFVALIVIFITYLLLPTFYSQSDISEKIKLEIKNKYNMDFKFSQSFKYNLFPMPHFETKTSIILDKKNEISKINKLKIFISLDKLFSPENLNVKGLIIENANFNLNSKNYNFFFELLDQNFKNRKLQINNSNIFFRNQEDEVLFINKILKSKYYYEINEVKNIFYSENEIFNIPFSIESFYGENKNNFISKIDLSSIKLKIHNDLNFQNESKLGKSTLILNNSKKNVEYEIKKDFFTFYIFDKIDNPSLSYKGNFNLKPFYASLNGNLRNINLNHLFGSNAIIKDFLKTKILNNKNIDFQLNINAGNIYDNYNFKNVKIKSKIKEGLIDLDKTKFEWQDFAEFELNESLIFVKKGELVLDGKLKIKIKNYNKIYRFLLTPKNYRYKIEDIDLNFTYNFDQKIVELKDIRIDNKNAQNVNKILTNINLNNNKLQNKIYLKNLLNDAIKNYAG